MADSTHKIAVSPTGSSVDVSLVTVAGTPVERQRISLADDVDPVALARIVNYPQSPLDYGLLVRPVFPAEAYGAFGGQRVVHEIPEVTLNFHYNVNSALVATTVANGGTVTQASSKAVLQTTANVAGSAKLESRAAVRYLPVVESKFDA